MPVHAVLGTVFSLHVELRLRGATPRLRRCERSARERFGAPSTLAFTSEPSQRPRHDDALGTTADPGGRG